MNTCSTIYNKEIKAHCAVINPAQGSIRIMVQVDRFEHQHLLNELWLYNFDADGNCVEFPFGVRHQDVEHQFYITYETTASLHRPPFRIEIRHQDDSEDLSKYGFTIFWELR